MSDPVKPVSNIDGKNKEHLAKVLQSKGMSKEGSKNIVDGKELKDPVDKAMDKVKDKEKEKIREKATETFVNRVKTSDKQQKAVLDFIKG